MRTRHHGRVASRLRTAVAFGVAAIALGCGSSTDDEDVSAPSEPETAATTSEGPASDDGSNTADQITAGQVEERTVSDRTYLAYAPATSDPSQPAPLVLAVHGANESPWTMVRRAQAMADTHGVVLAIPIANSSWDYDNDQTYVEEVLGDIESATSIDPERVYAVGHSRGGAFITYLACALDNRLTAIATNAFLQHHDSGPCTEPTPTDVVAIIGAADPITSDGGDHIQDQAWWPGGALPEPWPDEAAAWAVTNSCDPAFAEQEVAPDVRHHEYTCSGARFEVYVHPAGHIWAGDGPSQNVDGFTATDAMWAFFDAG